MSDVKQKIQEAKRTNCLTLSAYNLSVIPEAAFNLQNLARLDLSVNNISYIPASIKGLVRLRQLWMNDNPLKVLPAEISKCRALTTLDLSNTLISKLPKCLIELHKLIDLNLDGCPLNPTLATCYAEGFNSLWMNLQLKLDRKFYREEVFKRLKETLYPGEDPYALMQATFEVFEQLKDLSSQDLKLLLHNLPRVFPEKLSYVVPATVREKFDVIRDELKKREEVSDLALKLKSRYPTTDMQEIAGLAKTLQSEYNKTQLSQVFRLKMLPELFEEVSIDQIERNLQEHSMNVTMQLQKSMLGLNSKLKNVYIEDDPENISKCAQELGALFKIPALLTKFIINADLFLPEAIDDFDAHAIKQAFVQWNRQQTK